MRRFIVASNRQNWTTCYSGLRNVRKKLLNFTSFRKHDIGKQHRYLVQENVSSLNVVVQTAIFDVGILIIIPNCVLTHKGSMTGKSVTYHRLVTKMKDSHKAEHSTFLGTTYTLANFSFESSFVISPHNLTNKQLFHIMHWCGVLYLPLRQYWQEIRRWDLRAWK